MTVAGRFGLIGGATLCLALVSVSLSRAGDDDCKPDVQKLADLFEKNDLNKAAALGKDLAKKYEMDAFMVLFQPRRRGGFGVGEKAGAIKHDGIEDKIIDMAKKPLNAKDLDAQKDALIKMSYQTAALAEMTLNRCPVDKKQGKRDPAEWKKWSEDMRKYSLELAESAKKKDADAVKSAAGKLSRSCQKCHDSFR